ncbi:hypothetical protein FOC4_g10007148 [Fusarium odoratissimum]|uniref:DUF6546 domain-containing protein n=1 Tax=Fusarium oxysporum f. sp. cubense (strain race 4) TaxID=2502994 RepID=N1RJ93_FUSC4|nr:hypothetical protein FOC4_g10007148 [Fusarium odoratissimum]
MLNTTVRQLVVPEVPAVKKFILRRQSRRQFRPWTLKALLAKFPQLRSFVWESSRLHWGNCHPLPHEFVSSFGTGLPPKLKDLLIFEDCNVAFAYGAGRPYPPDHICLMADPGVAAALARGSFGLTRLHVPYMIDAWDFFKAYQKGCAWQHLESISLTSALLAPYSSNDKISELLCTASEVALGMPKLQSFAL